jgi:hypothetical protein
MNVYEKLKEEKLAARKSKDKPTIEALTYIQGEIEREYNNPDDSKVIPLLRAKEKKLSENESMHIETLGVLRDFLRRNTPKVMSKSELAHVLALNDISNMGQAQKFLKDNYLHQYDPAEVALMYRVQKEKI